MSDLGLDYTQGKRTQQDIDAQIRREEEADDQNMDGSKNNPSKEIPSQGIYVPSHEELHDRPAKEDQNSQKRVPLTNEHQNNENDINAYNTADITIAGVMFI